MSAGPLSARIAELAGLLDGTAITRLTLSEGGDTVTLHRHAASTSMQDPVASSPDGIGVVAPCPGIVLLAHPLRDKPLVVPDQVVAAGTVLALLQAGPLLVQVSAPRAGTVVKVEAAEGDLAGYGTPLIRLSPHEENA